MTIEIIPIESREQWLKAREQDLTASSDIAAVCGVHPYKSAMQVYAEKKGIVPPPEENGRMRGGRWFQPAVKEAFRETVQNFDIVDCQEYFRDPLTRIGCTPDYFGWPHGTNGNPTTVIDAKFISKQSWLKNWLNLGEDEDILWESAPLSPSIPMYIQFQNLVQVKLTGAARGMIGALVHDSYDPNYPQLFPLELDDEDAFQVGGTWDFIEECVAEFWKKFERGEPPEVMPELDDRLVSKIYNRDDGPALDLSDNLEVRNLLIEIERLKDEVEPHSEIVKRAADELKNLRTSLKAIMGFSQKATCGHWDVTCKLIERAPVAATSYRHLRIERRKG